jgi:hypothetical protein
LSNRLVCVILIFSASIAATSASQAAWAIAQSDNGEPIVARQCATEEEAKNNALEGCAKRTQNCEIVANDWEGCVAIANNGTKGTKWGFGQSHSKPRARTAALASCDAVAGGQCEITHEFCGR